MLAWLEKRCLGTALTVLGVEGAEEAFHATTTCADVRTSRHACPVLAVEITRMSEYTTKKGSNPGQKMAFLAVRDGTGPLEDIVCFPGEYAVYKDSMQEGTNVLMLLEKTKNGTMSVKKVCAI
jgi:DNA polymerase III alpha subunit